MECLRYFFFFLDIKIKIFVKHYTIKYIKRKIFVTVLLKLAALTSDGTYSILGDVLLKERFP